MKWIHRNSIWACGYMAYMSITPASAATLEHPALQLMDVFSLQAVEDARISPDGSQLAFVCITPNIQSDTMQSSIWRVDVSSKHVERLVEGSARSPRWSPDGERLAYLASDANGRTQVFVRSSHGKERGSAITQVNTSPVEPVWSPNGRYIAFTAFVPDVGVRFHSPLKRPVGASWAPPLQMTTEPNVAFDGQDHAWSGRMQLFVVQVASGDLAQFTHGEQGIDADVSWRPDSKTIVYTAGPALGRTQPGDHHLFEVDMTRPHVRALHADRGSDSQVVVSPDGRHLAFLRLDDHTKDYVENRLMVSDDQGGNARAVGKSIDRDFFAPTWSADGNLLFASYVDHGVSRLARFSLEGTLTNVAQDIGNDFSVAADGTVASEFQQAGAPAEIGLLRRGHAPVRLTGINDELLSRRSLGKIVPLNVISRRDHHPVDCWMTLPPGYVDGRRYPTILTMHGGPFGSTGPYWDTRLQLFAAAGYVVLDANYRGSTSDGFAFSDPANHDFPISSYEDLMSVVDAAVKAGVSDPNQLFITGESAGGVLTAWIVGKTNRFKAAVAVKPYVNQISESLTSDQFSGAPIEFTAWPWQDFRSYWARSPLSMVDHVHTPTMLMVGDMDRRTPAAESLQFYHALLAAHVPTAFVSVPQASHASLAARPSQFADETQVTLIWFAEHGSTARVPR